MFLDYIRSSNGSTSAITGARITPQLRSTLGR